MNLNCLHNKKEERSITVDQLQDIMCFARDFLFIGDEGERFTNDVIDLKLVSSEAPDDIILEDENVVGETFEGVIYISTSPTIKGYKIRGKNFFLNLYE